MLNKYILIRKLIRILVFSYSYNLPCSCPGSYPHNISCRPKHCYARFYSVRPGTFRASYIYTETEFPIRLTIRIVNGSHCIYVRGHIAVLMRCIFLFDFALRNCYAVLNILLGRVYIILYEK